MPQAIIDTNGNPLRSPDAGDPICVKPAHRNVTATAAVLSADTGLVSWYLCRDCAACNHDECTEPAIAFDPNAGQPLACAIHAAPSLADEPSVLTGWVWEMPMVPVASDAYNAAIARPSRDDYQLVRDLVGKLNAANTTPGVGWYASVVDLTDRDRRAGRLGHIELHFFTRDAAESHAGLLLDSGTPRVEPAQPTATA